MGLQNSNTTSYLVIKQGKITSYYECQAKITFIIVSGPEDHRLYSFGDPNPDRQGKYGEDTQ